MKQIMYKVALVTAIGCTATAQEQLRPAQRQPAAIDTEAASPAAKLRARSATGNVRLQWRAEGVLASASGFRTRHYAGTKQDAARAFLSEYRDLLGGIDPESLIRLDTKTLRSRTYVRYQQQMGGIPIKGAHLVVQVSPANAVEALQSRLEPKLKVKGTWNVDAATAEERATADMNPNGPARVLQTFITRDGEAIPVWRVLFRSGNPVGDWEILVSATDGSIIAKQDMRLGSDALGYAFPRNPVRGELERVALRNLVSDTHLSSPQTVIFTNLPALRGQVDPGVVVQGATRRGGHFLYNPDDTGFSEVQLYWAMETASDRFAALGFWGFDEPLAGTVLWQDYDAEQKRFVGASNAFFTPAAFGDRPGMFFYLTSTNGDTSLDTDVIFHEYAHAVINELVGPDQSANFKALNEGTADYFSSSFLDDAVMAEYAAKIFNSRTSFLRRTDNANRWPFNVVGESHADGNIWSGALWDVRRQLGPAVTDDIVINTIATLSPTAEFFDAASAAIAAAEELYGSRAAETVAGAMEARGIYTAAARTASRAITLGSGKHAAGSISGAPAQKVLLGAQQYRIEVPNRATRLIVRLQADAAVRFYVRYRVPITVEDGFIVAEQSSETGTNVAGSLTLENLPELQTGTYYIAVVNADSTLAHYEVQAEVENGDPTAPPRITLIENGGAREGSVPAGPFLASRQFAVEVPEGHRALAIRLEGDQDVDLYVRFAKPVRVNGTGFPEADVVSETEDTREDVRLVRQDGGTLPAGLYVIGVYNYSTETARFTVRARLE